MDDDSDEALKAKIAENEKFIEALDSGEVHIGLPYEGRSEDKVLDLKRQNAMWQSILDKRDAHRT
jgi:hypothetical protein